MTLHLVHRKVQGWGYLASITERVLSWRRNVQYARGVKISKPGLWLHCHVVHEVSSVFAFNNDIGLFNSELDIAFPDLRMLEKIASLMNVGRRGIHGIFDG